MKSGQDAHLSLQGWALSLFRVDAEEQEAKKKPTIKSASYESIVLCSNSKKEVRQYGAQRPSLDVAFTCGSNIAPYGVDVY